VKSVELAVQALTGAPGAQQARPTGERTTLDAGLVLRAVGYRGIPLPGLPFDPARGTLPHRDGRIIGEDGLWLTGWYASGWIKRGPSGVIGSNRADSADTVAALLADRACLQGARHGRDGLHALLAQRQCTVVSADGWRAIEQAEAERGRQRDKPAEKFVRIPDMLATADSASRQEAART
jgi:ferredoxin--NADP+ reductase